GSQRRMRDLRNPVDSEPLVGGLRRVHDGAQRRAPAATGRGLEAVVLRVLALGAALLGAALDELGEALSGDLLDVELAKHVPQRLDPVDVEGMQRLRPFEVRGCRLGEEQPAWRSLAVQLCGDLLFAPAAHDLRRASVTAARSLSDED